MIIHVRDFVSDTQQEQYIFAGFHAESLSTGRISLSFLTQRKRYLAGVLHYKVISLWPKNARVLVTQEPVGDLLLIVMVALVQVDVAEAVAREAAATAAAINPKTTMSKLTNRN